MKILYDHQCFSIQVTGGISRYFSELLNNFYLDNEIEYQLSLWFSNNKYLKSLELNNLIYSNFFENYSFFGKRFIMYKINTIKSIVSLSKSKFDVFHPTYYNNYFFSFLNQKPYVLTVHDMCHELFMDKFNKKEIDKIILNKKILINNADKIIAVSENTRNDIIKFFPNINKNKINVVYHANSLKMSELFYQKAKMPEKYILFVGNRIGYKNFENFVKAISLLIKEQKDLFVICIGGGKFSIKELKLFEILKISKNILQFTVSDQELFYYYKNAISFVYPSIYEGFGIPILEAFSSGCPCLLSNSSCFPEIAEDAAIYFIPENIESIKNKLEKIIFDKHLRIKLTEKGFKRLKDFSWFKTAKKTKEVYKSIM